MIPTIRVRLCFSSFSGCIQHNESFLNCEKETFSQTNKRGAKTIRKIYMWNNGRSNDRQTPTMTIALMNTIKNKFTCRKMGYCKEECIASVTLPLTNCISSTSTSGTSAKGTSVLCSLHLRLFHALLDAYCHHCTQNGSILDFNQSLFTLRAVSRNRLTYFPISQ